MNCRRGSRLFQKAFLHSVIIWKVTSARFFQKVLLYSQSCQVSSFIEYQYFSRENVIWLNLRNLRIKRMTFFTRKYWHTKKPDTWQLCILLLSREFQFIINCCVKFENYLKSFILFRKNVLYSRVIWKYSECSVIALKNYLEDSRLFQKALAYSESEITIRIL